MQYTTLLDQDIADLVQRLAGPIQIVEHEHTFAFERLVSDGKRSSQLEMTLVRALNVLERLFG